MSEKAFRILIIDDCAEDRVGYRRRLAMHREQDFQFWETEVGEDGLRLAHEIVPDCILLDFQLPDMDGLEILRRLRVDVATAQIPVIMLTGHGSETVAVQALKTGADDYLIKSLDNDRLRQTVQYVIEKSVLRRQLDAQSCELERLSAERVHFIHELQSQAAALSEANRRKDEFLATLAHELRNPLAPLRNSLEILRLTDVQAPAAAEIHGMMERQVNHMVRLVDDLLEASRITRGKIDLRKERIELASIVLNAVETSRPLIDAAQHEFLIELPSEPLVVEADAIRLSQVFANLLNNAAKYTEPGGQIWLVARRDRDEAVVSVRDTGMGVQADMLAKVFDMFTQIDRNMGRAQGGLGIGLALVKQLVKMHGGTVEARSAGTGKGTEFVVRLPLATVASCNSAIGKADADPPTAALPPNRVLIVDDNRDAADVLGRLLKLHGADVRVVHDGRSAIEALGAFCPAIILLDIGMPEMDGYEVARRIRQNPQSQCALLIAVTGWGQPEDSRRIREAGFDHHLVKPVQYDALRGLLVSPRH